MAHARVAVRESEYEQWLDVIGVGRIPISEDTDDIFRGPEEVARHASLTSLRQALIKLRGADPPPPRPPIRIEDPETGQTRLWYPAPWTSPERVAVEVVELPAEKFAARGSTYSVGPSPVALALLNGGILAVRVELHAEGSQEPTLEGLRASAAPLLKRLKSEIVHVDSDPHGAWHDPVTRKVDDPDFWIVHAYVAMPIRGKSVADALSLGHDVIALLDAADGGRLTRATVEALVESGRAGLLIGHSEEAWLECKEQPYAATETAHYELAKDVSAFANSQSGGLILIGLRTRKRAGRDYVTALAPVPPDDRRADRYRKVVGRRIHPRVTGLSVREVAYRSGAVLVISVPPQPQALWPFMVKGVLRANKIIGNHVAIFHRDDDATVITTVEELHALVIAGRAELAHTAADPTEKKPAAAMEA